MSSKPLVMSRACIQDTLLMKRLCPEKMTGLALCLYKLNIQELRRGQLAPHVETKMRSTCGSWRSMRFIEMMKQAFWVRHIAPA